MQRLELIIGLCLLAVGIGPVSWVILAGSLPPATTFGPAGLTGHDEGSGSREITQFTYFWFMISFFFVGIGAWFVIAGLKSRAIVSNPDPRHENWS
ncbi:MAG TPA: hypothetical protein VGQ13_06965 [Nitrososphaera sp.]|jgi:hypothetical protein|nr:hypothetical protein [Nitrososphaera sp.]